MHRLFMYRNVLAHALQEQRCDRSVVSSSVDVAELTSSGWHVITGDVLNTLDHIVQCG
uniref:Uncharacterized protein n=1 Tax=Arundo donax TaxID=35708 RepID=A0A0A9C2W3_ARUDO